MHSTLSRGHDQVRVLRGNGSGDHFLIRSCDEQLFVGREVLDRSPANGDFASVVGLYDQSLAV